MLIMSKKSYFAPAARLFEWTPVNVLCVSDPDAIVSNGEDMDPWEDNDDNNN